MKVSELITALSKLPQDSEVWISQDQEGNGFSRLDERGYSTGKLDPKEERYGRAETIYSDHHSDEDCCLEPGERDNMEPVVVLWP